MDFGFTPEQEAFRKEVREFIEKEFPPEKRKYGRSFLEAHSADDEAWSFTREMARKLGAKGWLSLAWPKEYGGKGSPILQAILTDELAYHNCPGWDIFGVGMIAPTLIRFASEEQKKQHLPGIARGEVFWCELLSEPEAGSDLASLRTRAVEKNDHFVLNGQKVWNTGAHRADWAVIVARTDPEVPKHRGISFFLLDMKTPGITVNPLINMAGHHEFNEVFLDEVKVPKENLVGGKNRGWYVVMALLDFERSCLPIVAMAHRYLEELLEYARQMKSLNPTVRHRLAELLVECEVGRLIHYRALWMIEKGVIPNYESAMDKMYSMELNQRVTAAGMQVLGPYAGLLPDSKWAPLEGQAPLFYLRSIGNTLEAGSSEVDRIVIAQRGLGLPRG